MEPTCAACAMEWSIQLEKGLRSSKPGHITISFFFFLLCSLVHFSYLYDVSSSLSFILHQVHLSTPYCKWGSTFSVGVESLSLALLPMQCLALCQVRMSYLPIPSSYALLMPLGEVTKKSGFLLSELSCLNESTTITGNTSSVKGCCQRLE